MNLNPVAGIIDSVGKIAGDLITTDKERMQLELEGRKLDQAIEIPLVDHAQDLCVPFLIDMPHPRHTDPMAKTARADDCDVVVDRQQAFFIVQCQRVRIIGALGKYRPFAIGSRIGVRRLGCVRGQ